MYKLCAILNFLPKGAKLCKIKIKTRGDGVPERAFGGAVSAGRALAGGGD